MSTRLALCDVRGLLSDVLDKLSGENGDVWASALKKFLRTDPRLATGFTRDMTKEGWTLLEDVPGDSLSIDKLEPVSFLKDGESHVGGEEMVKRAASLKANMGQRQAEYLLENQDTIPEELRKYVLVFPGTVWQGRGGYRRVPYLYWDGRRWCLNFHWLGHDCFDRYRLLRPRETA